MRDPIILDSGFLGIYTLKSEPALGTHVQSDKGRFLHVQSILMMIIIRRTSESALLSVPRNVILPDI